MVDLIEMVMSKGDMRIAALYDQVLVEDPQVGGGCWRGVLAGGAGGGCRRGVQATACLLVCLEVLGAWGPFAFREHLLSSGLSHPPAHPFARSPVHASVRLSAGARTG